MGDRFNLAPDHFDRTAPVGAFGMFLYEAVYGSFTGPIWCEDIYDTNVIKLSSRVEITAANQLFGRSTSDLAREKAICSHAREEVKKDLREAHTSGLLRNEHRRRKRALE